MRLGTSLLVLCALLLTACGGGGSAGSPAAGGSGVVNGGGAGGGGTPPTPAATCVTPPVGAASDDVAARGTGGLSIATVNGTVSGSVVESGVRAFMGVRYAAPPTGCLRFRPPQEPSRSEPTQAAMGPCVQLLNGSEYGQEDCLLLNVWAPDDADVHPVIVFLHGGTINGVDASRLAAATGAVVVVPNRRVGVFGLLALQLLADESSDHATGTYAVQDTIAALRWVQRNIAAFGGDPARVEVMGASAGGSVACSLFAAPQARGLFASAAVISGLCRPRVVVDASLARFSAVPPLKGSHAALIAAAGCDTAANKLDCLRNLPADRLLAAAASLPQVAGLGSAFPLVPVVDGVVVTSDPYSALQAEVAGSFRLLSGSNRDELRSLVTLTPLDDAGYRAFLRNTYGTANGDALYAIYPSSDYPTPTDAQYMLLSDQVFGCPAEALVAAASRTRSAYLYEYTRPNADGYAPHGIEFPPLFDVLEAFGLQGDQALAQLGVTLRSAFLALAASPYAPPLLDTGGATSLTAPAYDAQATQLVEFATPTAITSVYRGGRCARLNAIVPP